MYKLLIADDEKQTREGLLYFFQNNPSGFEVIGCADGGLSALEMTGKYEPDVILTDIRMPDLDGFSMIKRLEEFNQKPSVLIMSAYDDVEYFKSAFKVNAMDYILKPIDTTELLSVMEKIRKQLNTEWEERKKREEIQNQMKKNTPILRSRLFIDLINGAFKDKAKLKEQMDFLNISCMKKSCYNIVMISLDSKQTTYSGTNQKMDNALNFGILNLLEELLEIYTEGFAFEYGKGDFILLLMEESGEEQNVTNAFQKQVEELVDNFLNILRNGTNIRATIGIGDYVNDILEIPVSFQKAKENVYKRLIFGSNRIIQNQECIEFKDESLFHFIDEVKRFLSLPDQSSLRESVNNFFQTLSVNPNLDVLYGIQCSGMLMMAALESYMALHGNLQTKEEDILYAYEKLRNTETIPDMKRVVIEFCLGLNRTICGKMMDQNSETVKKVKDIIGKNYMHNIAIQTIAEQIYLSPNYICAVFKQLTGHTINQYITSVRIEAAKKLLADTTVKLTDIGFLIGYAEPSSFGKIFKKNTALTPKEYRQMMIGIQNN
ncbi:response regulator [Anaerocolumna sp. MB42-C2]|uniref:response regulator n=1 Tax=Anaerocolumna sp. MB42-C2 TaxID=3070997 RepID=UPI0027DFB8DF|nr:response regulator [Anaerocolumna sp. MB42-C2]WMJ85612.1 response regulator [Anaerocolumna sp. MB42-C2]